MEGLAYGFISLFWLVEIVGLFVSLCAILFGAIWLISKGGKPGCATRWPMGCPIVALVLGSLVSVTLGYCAVTWVYNDYLDARATCLELPLAESYKLGIFHNTFAKNQLRESDCVPCDFYLTKEGITKGHNRS